MATANLGNTKIDWSDFSKLRDDDTLRIVAAKCKNCKIVLNRVTDKSLTSHR